jgi:anaerobic selenocysteine-containing dehydrogenase/Fe-S-cluster-containing dehydrogenase component
MPAHEETQLSGSAAPGPQSVAPAGVRRREFLKVLGAAGATAATAACVPEKTGNLIPYLVSPEQTVPGVSTYYATTCRECSAGCGVIAETRDGRVIKLEGNPEHPVNRGALCARGQSALQGLYNPDRLRAPMIKENGAWKSVTWDDAITRVSQALAAQRGKGTVFLNQHENGSFPAFLDGWTGAMGMRAHLSVDFEAGGATIDAHRAAYGVAMPKLAFGDARLIVSFGADFLDGWGASVPQQLDFADARAKLDGAPRFIYIGARRSLTGLNADQWIACKPGSELAIAGFLRGQGSAADAARASDVPEGTLQSLARELAAARPALFVCGVRGDNAGDVGAAVAALNQSFGALGATVRPAEALTGFDGISRTDQVLAAIDDLRGGRATVFMVRGTNPVHSLPKSLKVADAIKAAPVKIAFALFPDETTELCDFVFPDHHSLESWGDAEPVRGTRSLQQPAMDPVFADTRHAGDVLIAIAKKDVALAGRYPAADYKTWYLSQHQGNQQAFATALTKGLLPGSAAPRPGIAAPAAAPAAGARPVPPAPTNGQFFVVTFPSATLGDGRGANKPWLIELPDPVTKVVWSSWVEIHPQTAARLGVERGDMLKVTTQTGSITAPAYVYLGVRPDVIAIPQGLGHAAAAQLEAYQPKDTDPATIQWGYGRYARNLGVNPLDLFDGASSSVTVATVEKTGDNVTIPSTEGSARQHGRGIAQAVTAAELPRLGQTPEGAAGGHGHIPGAAPTAHLPGLRAPVAADAQGDLGSPTAKDKGIEKGIYAPGNPLGMTKRRWAMTVDLARCTGCSACVTACYAENNIPTVGAAWQNATIYAVERPGFNVTRGREMAWLRIERYFEGAPTASPNEEFETRFVPMLCQHCGNAPCEPVCPVYATYHAPDGLNVQVYNRCVGTRYCSNNCPYKVRYFNWFGYGEPDRKQYAFPEPLNWQLNPDVTVRTKGVMEKCTFCVQRIREAENRASLEHRDLEPDEFTTACAAACPSRAIVFGDAADPTWSVAQLAQDRRAYHVFEELNTYTAVVYLKKVNHPTTGAGAPAPG